jgi:6-phosphogluconolactonase (cycloisomerase 2 family)
MTPGGPVGGSLTGFTYATPGGAVTAGTSSAFGTNGGPTAAVINPTGTFLYCVDPADQLLQAFPVDSGGFIAGPTPAPVPTPAPANVLALDPQGVNLYTGNADGTVSIFQVSVSGTATLVVPSVSVEPPAVAGASVVGIAVDPTGQWVVTANGPSGDVSLLQVAPGPVPTLTLVGTPYSLTNPAAQPTPAAVVFNGHGTVVYVANSGTNDISALSVSSSGLTPLPGSPFALPSGDTGPVSLAVSQ